MTDAEWAAVPVGQVQGLQGCSAWSSLRFGDVRLDVTPESTLEHILLINGWSCPLSSPPPLSPRASQWYELCRRTVDRQRHVLGNYEAGTAAAKIDRHSAGGDETLRIDFDFEQIILDEIAGLESNPRRTIISEEIGTVQSAETGEPEVVVIDPVDGSKNAAFGIPQFSLSVAVASGPTMDDVWFGYVYDFGTNEEHVASSDLQPRTGVDAQASALATSRLIGFESAEPPLLTVGLSSLKAPEVDEIRVIGSIAISLSYLAAGRLAGVLTCKGCRSVDAAAGQLIARCAGYEVLFDGLPASQAPLALEHEYRVVAGRGTLTGTLLSAQERIPPAPR